MFDIKDIEVVSTSQIDALRGIPNMPSGLYVIGDLDVLDKACLSVAGSRKIDAHSSQWLKDLMKQTRDVTFVSGLALGADAVAHRAALEYGKPTVAVLPSGFNNIAPRQHKALARKIVREGGCLISEYDPSKGPTKSSYVQRNRIIAALGRMLIVPQCDNPSGTMHTVNFANSYDKVIVVQDAGYSGNQHIINGEYKVLIK